MPHTRMGLGFSVVLVALSLMVVACEEKAQGPAASPQAETSAAWKLASAPAGGIDVAKAKAGAKEGDKITLVGRIGGRSEPITASSGLFVIMDPALPACSDNPEDNCATPWDYCCETPETITANAATVQLRDADGKPIVLADGELQPLSKITVVGTVAPRPNSDTLVVYATGVHVITEQ